MDVKKNLFKFMGLMVMLAMLLAASPLNQVAAAAIDVSPALQAGADRLTALQNDDGGWDWPLDNGVSATGSASNTVGPIAKGLAEAYAVTGDPAHEAALLQAGAFLLAKTNTFSPSDGYLAAALDEVFGGTTYVDHVVTYFYAPLAAGTYDRNGAGTLYDTAGYVNMIRTARSGDYANMAVWDIGIGLVGAASCGADTTAWIDGVKAEIDELDSENYYDVLGLAGAVYGLAFVGEDFDPTAGSHAAASSLADLADILASYQINLGGFAWNSAWVIPDDGNEAIQETAYAVLALNEVDREAYLSNIVGAADYMMSVQLGTGGWENYVGSSSGENNEITGEALWGIATAYDFPLTEAWVCETGNCGHPGAEFSSIQDAIDTVAGGATIYVAPGTYNEQLELRTPNITVISTDGPEVTIIDVPDGSLTTGVRVLADMGTVTFDGFTVKDFTENGIIQGMSSATGTVFHVKNNIVIPAGDYLRNGIQVTGDGSSVVGNYVQGAYLTEDWSSTAIGIVNTSNVLVQGNEIDGSLYGLDFGISAYNWNVESMQNITIIDNIINFADYSIDITAYQHTVSDVVIEYNQVTNYIEPLWTGPYNDGSYYFGESVSNVDASPNWWGSILGPQGPVTGEAVVNPWCGDADCSFTVPDSNGEIRLSGSYTVPGGIQINQPGLTIVLADDTHIENNSPCFVINADHTTITTESPLGAVCVPTDGANGIDVAGGLTNIVIDGLEIDGTVTGGTEADGINFAGQVTDLTIVDTYIHGLPGDGIYFELQPAGTVEIQGNLFMDNAGYGINNPNPISVDGLMAEYNSWGSADGPEEADGGDGIMNVDALPYTHVDLSLVSTKTPYPGSVYVGEQITIEVKANLVNAFGAAFTLQYPDTYYDVASVVSSDVFDWELPIDTSVPGEISFDGSQYPDLGTEDPASLPITASDITLFTVTLQGVTPATGLALTFDETSDMFSMQLDAGRTNNIYAAALMPMTGLEVNAYPTVTIVPSGDPVFAGVPVEFTVEIDNTDGRDLASIGLDFTLPAGAVLEFWDGSAWVDVTTDPYAYQDALGVPGTTSLLFRVTFVATGSNLVVVDLYDLTPVSAVLLASDSETFTALGGFNVTGTVAMQGRTTRSGVPMTLTDVTGAYTPIDITSTFEISNNVLFANVNAATYRITTNQPRYLNVYAGMDAQVIVYGNVALPAIELKGGNAVWTDNVINISDASYVGGQYGATVFDDGDVNFDNRVNIQDLALVGGNYTLTSETAYAGWPGTHEVFGNFDVDEGTGAFTAEVIGAYHFTITGQGVPVVSPSDHTPVLPPASTNYTWFYGTVTGDFEGTIDGMINAQGVDILYAIITPTSGDPVRLYGNMPFEGYNFDLVGWIGEGAERTPVSSVEIVGPTLAELHVGTTIDLDVLFNGTEAPDRPVTWAVYANDRDYATINQNGELTITDVPPTDPGVNDGKITVIVTVLDDSNLSYDNYVTISILP